MPTGFAKLALVISINGLLSLSYNQVALDIVQLSANNCCLDIVPDVWKTCKSESWENKPNNLFGCGHHTNQWMSPV